MPVGRLILDTMRRKLFRMVAAVGGHAVAVRTDCVYVAPENEAAARADLIRAGFKFGNLQGWASVGALKLDRKPELGMDHTLRIHHEPFPSGGACPWTSITCDRFTLENELATCENDWSEVDAVMPTPAVDHLANWRIEHEAYLAEKEAAEKKDPKMQEFPSWVRNRRWWWITGEALTEMLEAEEAESWCPQRPPELGPLFIEADVPGAGKTYLVKRWIERTGQKETRIIVCPWNALVTDCLKDGFRSFTLHDLLGKLAVEDHLAKLEKRAHKVDDVTHVHFEEVYLYSAKELGWIKSFMNHKHHISFTAAGDPGQLSPVNQVLADSDVWYERAFAQLFPRRLTLQISKRCSGPDRARMHTLCDQLRSESSPVVDTLRAAGLREFDFNDLTEEDAAHPHIAAMRSTMARVDHWAHSVIGETFQDEFEIGQTLLGVDGCRCKGGRICSNMTYEVKSVDERSRKINYDDGTSEQVLQTYLTVAAPDGGLRELTLESANKFLKRPYCMTGHATQGLSLGARIYVHDWNSHMATHRWIRTVMSRCGTLDIVLVNGSAGTLTSTNALWATLPRMPQKNSSGSTKTTSQMNGFEIDYTQQYSCYSCRDPLDTDWSVDRLDNTLPHLKDNCAISCRRCQNASSHRPTFHPSPKPMAATA